MKINGIKIKPGMVLIVDEGARKISYVIFPCLDGSLGVISLQKHTWDSLSSFIKTYHSKIVAIHDMLDSSECGCLLDGDILWEKPKEIVITIEQAIREVAKKYGVKPNQIRIES